MLSHIPAVGDTRFYQSLISICRAVEGFIRDKYEKKKYMDRSLDINALRVGRKSFIWFLLVVYFLISPGKNLKDFHLINEIPVKQPNGPKWSVHKCESSLSRQCTLLIPAESGSL